MKRTIRAAAALGLSAVLALTLTGCGHHSNSFTWQVDAVPNNLDPQLASSSANRIAVTHLYSGLFRMGPDGKVQNECAQDYQVSADGCTYTFILKEGLVYRTTKGKDTDYTVTAEDFVFGLQRVFLPETRSPYAAELGNIAGSQTVLNGGSPNALGVRALDDLTLEIRLSTPDEHFLEKLCLPGAMPCDPEFFKSTGGSYGLNKTTTISNGSFYLYSWTESGLFMRRTPEGKLVDNLRLVRPSSDEVTDGSSQPESAPPADPVQDVLNEKCTAALATGSTVDAQGLTQIPFTSTTWTLVFRSSDSALAAPGLRAALTQIAWNTDIPLSQGCTRANGLMPPSMNRPAAGLPSLGDPAVLYKQGLEEAGISSLTGLTVIVPTGASHLFGQINQEWQRQLQAFFSVKELPPELLLDWVSGRLSASEADRLEKQYGRWAVALVPVEPLSSDPASLLRQFDNNLGRWENNDYHTRLEELIHMPGGSARDKAALQLEQQLLREGPVAPLFYQSHSLVVSSGVRDLVFDPFGPMLDVTYTTLN